MFEVSSHTVIDRKEQVALQKFSTRLLWQKNRNRREILRKPTRLKKLTILPPSFLWLLTRILTVTKDSIQNEDFLQGNINALVNSCKQSVTWQCSSKCNEFFPFSIPISNLKFLKEMQFEDKLQTRNTRNSNYRWPLGP